MSKDPAFLFYPNDYIGGTMGMTFEEKGAYIELLMLQFNRGHMTSHMIGQTVGQLWDNIKCKFKVDKNGLYYNERLDIEIERRKTFVNSRHNNISGNNQYSKKRGQVTAHMGGHVTSHMENENIDRNEGDIEVIKDTVIKTGRDKAFDAFWSCYPRKSGKAAARKAFDKVPRTEWDKLVPAVEAQKLSAQWQKENGQFIPLPTTWLNQGRWDDELPEAKSSNPFLNILQEEGRLF